MSLVSLTDVRALITTALDDMQLQTVIDREETELIARLGPHGENGITLMVSNPSGTTLFLPRQLSSITSVSEQAYPGATGVVLDTTQYWYDGATLNRATGLWPTNGVITVTGLPIDLARRKSVLIELVRLALEQTAMKSENIAGEYSYTAPEWERTRADLYRRVTYMSL